MVKSLKKRFDTQLLRYHLFKVIEPFLQYSHSLENAPLLHHYDCNYFPPQSLLFGAHHRQSLVASHPASPMASRVAACSSVVHQMLCLFILSKRMFYSFLHFSGFAKLTAIVIALFLISIFSPNIGQSMLVVCQFALYYENLVLKFELIFYFVKFELGFYITILINICEHIV